MQASQLFSWKRVEIFCLKAVPGLVLVIKFFFKGSHESLCISYLTAYTAKVLFGSQVIPEFVKLYLKAAVLKHPFISVFSGSSKGETRMISVVQGN